MTPGEDEEALPNQESADSVRRRCFNLWEEMKDVKMGEQSCPLCAADPFGSTKIYSKPGAVCEHIIVAVVHDHSYGHTERFSKRGSPLYLYIGGLKGSDGRYRCRVEPELSNADMKGAKRQRNDCSEKITRADDMRLHMLANHPALLERLNY